MQMQPTPNLRKVCRRKRNGVHRSLPGSPGQAPSRQKGRRQSEMAECMLQKQPEPTEPREVGEGGAQQVSAGRKMGAAWPNPRILQ